VCSGECKRVGGMGGSCAVGGAPFVGLLRFCFPRVEMFFFGNSRRGRGGEGRWLAPCYLQVFVLERRAGDLSRSAEAVDAAAPGGVARPAAAARQARPTPHASLLRKNDVVASLHFSRTQRLSLVVRHSLYPLPLPRPPPTQGTTYAAVSLLSRRAASVSSRRRSTRHRERARRTIIMNAQRRLNFDRKVKKLKANRDRNVRNKQAQRG
jgi:hypothetical protein